MLLRPVPCSPSVLYDFFLPGNYLPTCNVTYARVYSLTDNVGSDHSFTSTALFFCSMSCLLPSSTSTGSATSSVSQVLSIRLSTEAFSSSPSSPVVSCGEHMARGECLRTSIEPSSQIATSCLTPRARKLPTRCAKSALWALCSQPRRLRKTGDSLYGSGSAICFRTSSSLCSTCSGFRR